MVSNKNPCKRRTMLGESSLDFLRLRKWFEIIYFDIFHLPLKSYVISAYGWILLISSLLNMISQEKRIVFILYSVIICVFILCRIHNISTLNPDIKSVSHIKTLAFTEYHKRQSRIQYHCRKGDPKLLKLNEDSKWKKSLFFDYEHSLIFCGISKVSSTTWTTNLLRYVREFFIR